MMLQLCTEVSAWVQPVLHNMSQCIQLSYRLCAHGSKHSALPCLTFLGVTGNKAYVLQLALCFVLQYLCDVFLHDLLILIVMYSQDVHSCSHLSAQEPAAGQSCQWAAAAGQVEQPRPRTATVAAAPAAASCHLALGDAAPRGPVGAYLQQQQG
jgi:hypothetical protein